MARNESPDSMGWLRPGYDSSPLRLLKSKIQPPLFRPLIIPAVNHEGLLSRSNICTASNRGAEISPLGAHTIKVKHHGILEPVRQLSSPAAPDANHSLAIPYL